MNKPLIVLSAVVVILSAAAVGWYFWPKAQQIGSGGCGDGVCDAFEKNAGVCAQDCGGTQEQTNNTVGSETTGNTSVASTAEVTVDWSKTSEVFSPQLSGINGSIAMPENDFKRAQDAGFGKIMLGTTISFEGLDATSPFGKNSNKVSFKNDIKELSNYPALYGEITIGGPAKKYQDQNGYDGDFSIFKTNVGSLIDIIKQNISPDKITVFRFGNEPDNNAFWPPDKQEVFFQLYAALTQKLKEIDPSYIVDGPGLMVGVSDESDAIDPWTTAFLSYMEKNKVPVDLLDVHHYSPDPYSFYKKFGLLKAELAKHPQLSPLYGTPKLANNEWNMFLGDEWSGSYHKFFDTAWAASFQIIAQLNMIDQGVVSSFPITNLNGCRDYTLVSCTNGKETGFKPAYYAWRGFNQLIGLTRLAATGSDHRNFAIAAGRSQDGNIATIIMSNYDLKQFQSKYLANDPVISRMLSGIGEQKTYNKYDLTLKNLPWKSSDQIIFERYIVDDTKKLELVETKTVAGASTLSFSGDIAAPSVEVLKIYKKSK